VRSSTARTALVRRAVAGREWPFSASRSSAASASAFSILSSNHRARGNPLSSSGNLSRAGCGLSSASKSTSCEGEAARLQT